MSRTLNLCEQLLAQGRNYHDLGADDRALRTLTSLSGLRDLPGHVAEEAQSRLAELFLKKSKFARARRHIAACLAGDPGNAHYHYLMAIAHEDDRRGNPDLALEHYRRCIRLEPEDAVYHRDAGLFALHRGAIDEGLSYLRQAVALTPNDAVLVGDVVRGLQDEGHHDEARQVARAALFRNSRDPQFQRLWNDCRFQEQHHDQQRSQKRRVIRRAVAEGRVCLPFLKMTVDTPKGRKMVREDGPAGTPAPHILRLPRTSGRKHA